MSTAIMLSSQSHDYSAQHSDRFERDTTAAEPRDPRLRRGWGTREGKREKPRQGPRERGPRGELGHIRGDQEDGYGETDGQRAEPTTIFVDGARADAGGVGLVGTVPPEAGHPARARKPGVDKSSGVSGSRKTRDGGQLRRAQGAARCGLPRRERSNPRAPTIWGRPV